MDSSRGSYWCTGSSVARYRPSQAIRNRSWARYLICPAYQSGSSSSGTTFSTCHTGRVEITHGASMISSSKNSFGSTRGWRATATPLTSWFSITTRSTAVPSRSSPPCAVIASARSAHIPSQPCPGQQE